jgi:cytochrome b561/polyisoprenoid-binding protein YceI
MSLLSTPSRWGFIAKLFHWTMALGILALCAYGFWMTDLPRGPAMMKAYAFHKSCGLTLLALALLRLVWRMVDRAPQPLPVAGRYAGWQHLAARGTHALLYGLMLAVPLAGWAYNSASHFPLQWFGVVNLPALVPADPAAKEWYEELHEAGAIALLVLVAAHVAAAWKHHLIDRDDTLRRMLPGAGAVALVTAGAFGLAMLATPAPSRAAGTGAATKAANAKAPAWRMDAARSQLTFKGTQQGEAFTGRFVRFAPQIAFSPEALAASRWVVTIDVGSNDSANAERDETMRLAEWFDVARYPQASFTTSGFRAGAAPGNFIADGELVIKGRKARIALPFRWTAAADGRSATLAGQVVLDRHAFALGTGDWMDDAWVGRSVTVGVQLALAR